MSSSSRIYDQFIDGQWRTNSREEFNTHDPSTGERIWIGTIASKSDVHDAVSAAEKALRTWASTPLVERIACVKQFEAQLNTNRDEIEQTISLEIGKPRWESKEEVNAMLKKIDISIEAHKKRCAELEHNGSITRFKPIGVCGVLGPFNFPGHLPNGHIIPALIAGNTLVFKPSNYASLTGQKIVQLWEKTDLPTGVINLVQGDQTTGKALALHPKTKGIFFTGSARAGRYIHEKCARKTEKMLVLEMGGNNPLLVHNVSNIEAAAFLTVQSAFLTAGQRCTCARRLIIPKGNDGDSFLKKLTEITNEIRIGAPTDLPEPFMGPVITKEAAIDLLNVQRSLNSHGGTPLTRLRITKPSTGMVTPGIMDVTNVTKRKDSEVFGPLLKVIRTENFEDAIIEANATAYGLAAGLISDDETAYQTFYNSVKAGVINWNHQLTGASSYAPFGGIGRSGNYRPSAFFAADYCAYPVASIEKREMQTPENLPPGLPKVFS